MELGSSGGALQACRRLRVEVRRSGELWRRAAGGGTWRRQRGIALWRFAAGVSTWRCLSQERWSSGVLLLLLKFLAFVPQGSLSPRSRFASLVPSAVDTSCD